MSVTSAGLSEAAPIGSSLFAGARSNSTAEAKEAIDNVKRAQANFMAAEFWQRLRRLARSREQIREIRI
ncbi:MAG TPA: hypothetical protein VL475_03445 [Planctomycetaceae bacterium]|nr:hypothetical protein [Planctomycetaceae bacterium]